jgi:hypothetical protein
MIPIAGGEGPIKKQAGERSLKSGQENAVVRERLFMIAAAETPQPSKVDAPAVKPIADTTKESSKGAARAVPATASDPPAKPSVSERPQPKAPQTTPAEQANASDAKSQSILQMLEGHETEVKIGLIIAASAFLLGWICGVGYYERRQRKWRHKLRF